MCKFYVVSGRVTEAHRFINVPLRWAEEYPARERREIWITTPEGQEVKLVVHSRQMPARVGHQVDGLLLNGRVLGLNNATTGGQVNFMTVDPPLVWSRLDSLWFAMLLGVSFLTALFGLTVPAIGGFLVALVMPMLQVMRRLASRIRLRRKVDSALERVATCGVRPPQLHRVK